SSSVEIEVNISIFKQITLDKYCQIPYQKPQIEEIDYTNIDVKVINSYVITTPKIVANEGQILSGFKLIIHGLLKVIVEYTADIDDQAIHSTHYDIPFSSFIILPPDYKMGAKVEVSAVIESADTISVGPKEVFINAAILLVANIPQ
ncbi:SPOCS domain-containing protein, partial [Paraclostridium bifermentans]|uniref:SPOCS domain-containing protein n=1 Tax=Paraclostridium bifermentans TaxID=1490 RepID=UPI00359CA15F